MTPASAAMTTDRPPSGLPLPAKLAAYRNRIEGVLDDLITRAGGTAAPRLVEAMRYSTLAGGKRLRPALAYLTAEALGARLVEADAPAAALELIHVYSLVHDDLPAMDDDDLRHGRPTCHKAYDEATAILVGDALQCLAFGVLAGDPPIAGAAPPDPAVRLHMIRLLARGIGTDGMAGGQAIDLAAVGKPMTEPQLERMHRLKTGALIQTSVLLGAAAAGHTSGPLHAALVEYSGHIGLAFQIQDDILDVRGNTAALGKTAGADAAHHKPTYPSTVGMEEAVRRAIALRDRAVAALEPLGERGTPLRALAHFFVDREH